MKILLTGTTGQVGWELQQSLKSLGTVISTGRTASQVAMHMDLARPDTIRRALREVKPDLIVNAAAYTAVDKAELDADMAMAINGIAPGILAEEAKLIGAAVIHYSTDYVFDGKKHTAYTELDLPNPQNIYGKTKLTGEQAIEAVGGSYLIFRTSWVYSRRRNNFLLTILRLAQEREELRVVNDQVGVPTWSRLVAEATAQILFQTIRQNLYDFLADKSGIYHLSATGQASWYSFAKAIVEQEQKLNKLKLQRLTAIASEQYPTPAKRPAYSVLDNHKLFKTFGVILPNWQRTLQLVLTPEAIAS